MSYQAALGTDWSKVSSLLSAGTKVLEDPAFSQLTCEVLRLAKAQKGQDPGLPCLPTAQATAAGVGLSAAILPMRALVYQKRHPWFFPVVGVGAVGLLVTIGYAIGRSGK